MFQNLTESLSSTQIEMLKAIAHGEQHFSSQAVKQIYNLGNPNTIVKNKKILQNKDIIEKEKENFAFVDPIYRLWFKQEYCWKLSIYYNVSRWEKRTSMLRFLGL